ncbi:cytochrome b [Lysobacteraceae bacterium NML95-0200]|nr:cytochrome b [Xanthomonadaceae bacterium NML95-0200]
MPACKVKFRLFNPEASLMTIRPASLHWNGLAKFFHWSIVILLLVQGIAAVLMDGFPREMRGTLMMLHKSTGVLILLLAIARLAWRLMSKAPPALPEVSAANRMLAQLGHVVLYVLLFAVPLSGFLMSAYGGRVTEFYGLFALPNFVAANESMNELMHEIHAPLFFALVLVAAGHAAAALYHHYIKRDATLIRMLPDNKT